MCGIVGLSWPDKQCIINAIKTIEHRGPDAQNYFVDDDVSLGHVRLSILDTSEAGNQPMIDTQNQNQIIFNGEIYNFQKIKDELLSLGHIFENGTDTEVILKGYAQWGVDVVKRFNGMWAFCLYDVKKKLLFLSRDRFGQKPLYYTFSKGKLMFASEIKALLLQEKPIVNKKILADYLYYDFLDHTNETFFKRIKKLPSSHNATFNLRTKKLMISRYYKLKKNGDNFLKTFEDACLHRTIADVPITLSLSGGVDSSSIGAIYARKNMKLKAFTTISKTGIGDETKKIKLLQKKYPNTFDLHKSTLDIKNFITLFSKGIYHLESPCSPGVIPRMSIAQTVSKQKYKILISGEGSDEMLGGYASAYPFITAALLKNGKIYLAIKTLIEGKEYFTKRTTSFFIYYLMPKLVKKLLIKTKTNKDKKLYGYKINFEILQRLRNSHFSKAEEYFEYGLYRGGIPHLLNYNDKLSMAYGVELRAPFMDINLVERMMSIPAHHRVGKGYTKYALRNLMNELVPKKILWDKEKIGYQAPLQKYLRRKETQSYIQKNFAEPKCAEFIDKQIFLQRYNDFLEGNSDNVNYLFKVLSVEIWLRTFFK